MKRLLWITSVTVAALTWAGTAGAALLGQHTLNKTNREIHGHVLDFTRNKGPARRFGWAALGEKRDLYVSLPPDFDPPRRYPFAIFLHGATQDEGFFLKAVRLFDR